ncbi:MAG TPA: hypothetical protein VMT34_06545 [Aggregatilineales bacterium]|nr:hypothetical protein [Aggregatilineales bacterium]
MKGWLCGAGSVCAILTLACVLAIGVGRTSQRLAPDLQAFGLDRCAGGLPCFLGIVPGVTAWDDAHRNLEQHAAASGGTLPSLTRPTGAPPQDATQVYLMPGTPTADDIEIVNIHANLSLASAIALFGVPCKVAMFGAPSITASRNLSDALLIYPQLILHVNHGDSLEPASTITAVGLVASDPSGLAPNPLCDAAGLPATTWQGFATWRQYFFHMLRGLGRQIQ